MGLGPPLDREGSAASPSSQETPGSGPRDCWGGGDDSDASPGHAGDAFADNDDGDGGGGGGSASSSLYAMFSAALCFAPTDERNNAEESNRRGRDDGVIEKVAESRRRQWDIGRGRNAGACAGGGRRSSSLPATMVL